MGPGFARRFGPTTRRVPDSFNSLGSTDETMESESWPCQPVAVTRSRSDWEPRCQRRIGATRPLHRRRGRHHDHPGGRQPMDPEREQLRAPLGAGRRRVQEGDGRDCQHRRAAARHVLRRRVGPARRRYRSGPGLQPGELPAVHGRPAQQVPERAQPVRRR